MGLLAGTPTSAWLEVQKMTHEKEMKATDVIETERERKDRNELITKAMSNLPTIVAAIRGMLASQPQQTEQILGQLFTPEDLQKLSSAAMSASQRGELKIQPQLRPQNPSADVEGVKEVPNHTLLPAPTFLSVLSV